VRYIPKDVSFGMERREIAVLSQASQFDQLAIGDLPLPKNLINPPKSGVGRQDQAFGRGFTKIVVILAKDPGLRIAKGLVVALGHCPCENAMTTTSRLIPRRCPPPT
jgi:hypothetical protein